MNSNRWSFKRTMLSTAVALLSVAPALAQTTSESTETAAPKAKEDAVRLGTITVVGSGNKLGTGMMVNDDSVKGRSMVTQASLEKDRSTSNSFQAIALLPGVNTYNYDSTGLFGGGLTIRGFNADQLGFTVNGVPVNDSGNFAVYPQEFIDTENVCSTSLGQGSTELETPSGGASGGAISIITCDPTDKRRVRVSQTLGGLNMTRSFVRVDSGRFANDMAKVFLSYSHTQADKWKGEGKAKKDHMDFGFTLDLSPDDHLLGSVLYNRAVNNNIYSVSAKQIDTYGYNYDYASTFTPQTVGVKGTAQKETAMSPIYYGTSLNPFADVIASVSGSFKVAKDTYVKVQPYFWYGFGNGGWSEVALSEATGLKGGAVDINGDGDTLDTIRVARSSVTRTQRPGLTAEVSTIMGNHSLKAGVWYERAQHRQTQPAVRLNADGTPSDMWLTNGCITRADGSCYEGRDWKTVSTSYQAYVSDQFSFMDDRGLLSLGLRTPHVTRDVTNYASETGTSLYTTATATTGGTTVYRDYNINRSFSKVLPQLGGRFNLDNRQQVFMSVAKNFRAPPNTAFTGSNVRFVNDTVVPWVSIKPETTVMTDLGYRFQSPAVSLTATLFNSDFKDRQATAIDPNTQLSVYTNAGRVNNRGLELEAGSGVYRGFSVYGSLTLQKSKIKDNLQVSTTVTLPTAGKQFTLTPKYLAGLAVQYEDGPFYVRTKVKYNGSQMATLMNDESAPAYVTGDVDAGYKFGDVGLAKNIKLAMNISNIGNTKYRNPSSGSVNNAVAYGTYAASTVYYYLGAPRLTTFTLSADFE